LAPYPSRLQLEPAEPLRRDDADDVGQALPAGDATLLDEEQPEQLGLAQGSLDRGSADAGERGDRVDGKDAGAGALNLPRDDRQDRQLGRGERRGDLGRHDPAHGLPAAPLKRSLSVRRARMSPGGLQEPRGRFCWLSGGGEWPSSQRMRLYGSVAPR